MKIDFLYAFVAGCFCTAFLGCLSFSSALPQFHYGDRVSFTHRDPFYVKCTGVIYSHNHSDTYQLTDVQCNGKSVDGSYFIDSAKALKKVMQ